MSVNETVDGKLGYHIAVFCAFHVNVTMSILHYFIFFQLVVVDVVVVQADIVVVVVVTVLSCFTRFSLLPYKQQTVCCKL